MKVKSKIFGKKSDLGLCGTFCAPYQLYTNAEKLGDNGLLYYLLYFYNPCLPIYLQRRNLRQRYYEIGAYLYF